MVNVLCCMFCLLTLNTPEIDFDQILTINSIYLLQSKTDCCSDTLDRRQFLAAKRSSTRALVLCLSVRPSVRLSMVKTAFLIVLTAYDNL